MDAKHKALAQILVGGLHIVYEVNMEPPPYFCKGRTAGVVLFDKFRARSHGWDGAVVWCVRRRGSYYSLYALGEIDCKNTLCREDCECCDCPQYKPYWDVYIMRTKSLWKLLQHINKEGECIWEERYGD